MSLQAARASRLRLFWRFRPLSQIVVRFRRILLRRVFEIGDDPLEYHGALMSFILTSARRVVSAMIFYRSHLCDLDREVLR